MALNQLMLRAQPPARTPAERVLSHGTQGHQPWRPRATALLPSGIEPAARFSKRDSYSISSLSNFFVMALSCPAVSDF